MTREDKAALNAIRHSTLKSLKAKKQSRLQQLKNQYEKDVREINIKYAEDPERLRAKYAADDYARSEREKRRAAKRIAREKKRIKKQSAERQFSLGEEIFSAIVQGLGAVLSIAATAILVFHAANYARPDMRIVYIATFATSAGLFTAMYIFSTLHHALVPVPAKEVFDRLTHVFIFLALGSVYTSFTLSAIGGAAGWVLFGIVWGVSVVGIILYAIWGNELLIVNIVLYLVVGWAGMALAGHLYKRLPTQSFVSLILCGVFYSAGCAFILLRKIKYMHAIGNMLLLLGTVQLFSALFHAAI